MQDHHEVGRKVCTWPACVSSVTVHWGSPTSVITGSTRRTMGACDSLSHDVRAESASAVPSSCTCTVALHQRPAAGEECTKVMQPVPLIPLVISASL